MKVIIVPFINHIKLNDNQGSFNLLHKMSENALILLFNQI